MRLAILGAGSVGRAVASRAPHRGHTVVAWADSRSATVASDGIDVEGAIDRKERDGTVGTDDPETALDAPADAVVEATPTTLDDADPGFSHAKRALAADRHVVLANKGPVAERYDDLRQLERDSAGTVRFEATVAGAIPVLATIEDYGAEDVSAARGVLNGTANFVLTRMMAEGLDYEHVLAEAQDLGVAEADPSFDVNGTDAALKCVILANVLRDGGYTLDDATVEGIAELPTSALELAREDGRTVRLIGEVAGDGAAPASGGELSIRVGPRLVPETAALAVDGTRNLVQLETETAGRLNLSGRGAGGDPTAAAVLADVGRLDG